MFLRRLTSASSFKINSPTQSWDMEMDIFATHQLNLGIWKWIFLHHTIFYLNINYMIAWSGKRFSWSGLCNQKVDWSLYDMSDTHQSIIERFWMDEKIKFTSSEELSNFQHWWWHKDTSYQQKYHTNAANSSHHLASSIIKRLFSVTVLVN